MAGGYRSLPTSNLLGSVPAAVDTYHKASQLEEENLQIFPPNNAQDGMWGYQPPTDGDDPYAQPGARDEGIEQSQSVWKRIFSIETYRPYFNIETYDVIDRTMFTLYPLRGDFCEKVQHNPDMYGPLWISTTLVFAVAALGNYASYLQSEHKTDWYYDINYISWAACFIYGYLCLVPLGFYFLLRYWGISTPLVQLWCLYGYSLFTFIPASILLIFPTEFLRWTVIALAGLVTASFVALNMRSCMSGSDKWMTAAISAFLMQMCLALVIKLCFFV